MENSGKIMQGMHDQLVQANAKALPIAGAGALSWSVRGEVNYEKTQ